MARWDLGPPRPARRLPERRAR